MGRKYTNEQLERAYLDACNRIGRWVSFKDLAFEEANMPISLKTYKTYYKNAYNLRHVIQEKYPDKIRFNLKNYIRKNGIRIGNRDNFYDIFIQESLKRGFKMATRDMEECKKLPSQRTISFKFGGVKDIHNECSLRSKEFAKLPTRKIGYTNRGLKKYDIAMEYINKCLLNGAIRSISCGSFIDLNISFSYSIIKSKFRSSGNFYKYCREISPEYDELFRGSRLDRDRKAK